jgi:hypothetical protein
MRYRDAEFAVFGFGHELVGARLAARWKFPEPLVSPLTVRGSRPDSTTPTSPSAARPQPSPPPATSPSAKSTAASQPSKRRPAPSSPTLPPARPGGTAPTTVKKPNPSAKKSPQPDEPDPGGRILS